jgi:haloalkane dehalogenase
MSSKPDAGAHTLANHATWLRAAIDQVIGQRPIVVAAQDWGGPIAMCALAGSARLRGIVLGNTVVGPPPAKFKPTVFHRLARLPIASEVLFRTLGFPLGVLHLSQGDRSTIRGKVARAYRWPLAHRAERAAPLALARMVPDSADRHPSIPQLQIAEQTFVAAQVPVALVWGMRDPILGRVVNHVARLRPDATVRKTEAGHFLQEEVPEPLAEAILDVAGRASWA